VKSVLVLGGASSLWDDLRALGPFQGTIIAVNDSGAVYPHRIDHLCSLHGDKIGGWARERRRRGLNADFLTWTRPEHDGLADRYLSGWSSGSSGLFAVGVALELGAESVVLAGVPMQASAAHFFDREPWDAVSLYLRAWEARADALRGRVYSMSGWTRDLLGPPPDLQQEAA
jgi:hypothetical protein